MYEVDATSTHAINGLAGQSAIGDLVMLSLTIFGVPLMVLLVALQWWRKAERSRNRHIVVTAGFSFLLGLGMNQVILLFIQRARPYETGVTRLLINPTADFSFPSDHSTAAFAIATAFLLHGSRIAGLAFLAIAILISVSRVYVGTHYVSDAVGGALVGIIAALFACAVYREGSRADRIITSIL